MTALAEAIVGMASVDALGELLRELTFPGEGVGCYTTFVVRQGATAWREEDRRRFWEALGYDEPDDPDYLDEIVEMGDGCTWRLGDLVVDVCWFWDGDGVLVLEATDGKRRRRLENTDCKKDYGWHEPAPTADRGPASAKGSA